MFTARNARLRVLFFLSALLLLTSCGGGGSGGGGSVTLTATTSISNDPAEGQTIAWFTMANVFSLSILGDSDLLGGVPLSASSAGTSPAMDPDTALQLVTLWLANEPLEQRLLSSQDGVIQAQAVLPRTTEPCDNLGGTTTVSGQIANLVAGVGLGAVAIGDYIDSEFSNCELDGVTINGSLRITVDSFSFTPGNVPDILDFLLEMELGPNEFDQMGFTLDFGQLDITVGDAFVIYDGDFSADKDWRSDLSLEVLDLTLSANDLQLTIAGMRMQAPFPAYRLRQYSGSFAIDKRPVFTTYVASGRGWLETSDFAGLVRFDIVTPFSWEGEFGVTGTVWPTAGAMDIFGSAEASIRATANPDNMAPFTDVLIEADVDADGVIVTPTPDLSLMTSWDILSVL